MNGRRPSGSEGPFGTVGTTKGKKTHMHLTHEWRNSGVKDPEHLAKGATLTENTRSCKVPRVEH